MAGGAAEPQGGAQPADAGAIPESWETVEFWGPSSAPKSMICMDACNSMLWKTTDQTPEESP